MVGFMAERSAVFTLADQSLVTFLMNFVANTDKLRHIWS